MSRFATRCPNCSAPIAFGWSQSVQTVCTHCRSVVVRHDVDVTALGKVASVPPDISPIQVGTRGRFENRAFEVVGRIVYEYEDGGWNEWHVVFDDGQSGWLSDAQAEYAVSVPVGPDRPLPGTGEVKTGKRFAWRDRDYVATTITQARYAGVEGELPFVTWDRNLATFADFKTTTGHFATIDYSEQPPLLFLGRFAEFDELSFSNLREITGGVSESAVRGFNCPACAAAIALRGAQHTTAVACPSCGTIVSPRDPNLRVLQDATLRQAHAPKIPLGSRGVLDGDPWDVIGFQYRTITVEGEDYGWDEYLLLNPYRGFRYLSEYQGHWNVIRPLKELPGGDRVALAEHGGDEFKRFQGAMATTRVVLGEFPWRVRAGDTVETIDFVAPPLLLSNEREGEDETWSVGTYTPGASIWSAFSLPGDPPLAIGVFANQPSPYAGRPRLYWRIFGLLALLWLALVTVRCAQADRRVVYGGTFTFAKAPAAASGAFVTPEFEIPGDVANVEVQANARSLQNDWLSLAVALVDVNTGTALDFGLELSYYSGVEDGEAWSEGDRSATRVLPSVPGGRYLLRVEPAGGDAGRPIAYDLRLRRDVPRVLLPLLVLGLLAIPPVLVAMAAAGFERQRWAESGDASADASSTEDEEDED
jgi:hypothetical protein